MAVSTAQSITCPKPSPSRAPGGREQNKVSPPRSSDFQLQISNFRFPIQRWLDLPFLPICLLLRPYRLLLRPCRLLLRPCRLGWMSSMCPTALAKLSTTPRSEGCARKRRLCQKAICPVLVSRQQAKKAGALWQVREMACSMACECFRWHGLQHGLRMFSLAWLAAWLANVFVGMACECFCWSVMASSTRQNSSVVKSWMVIGLASHYRCGNS